MVASGEIFPGIVSDPQIMAGTPVIAGTRVPVSVVLGHLAAGDSIETVLDAYELTAEQIRAAFGYATRIVGDQIEIDPTPQDKP